MEERSMPTPETSKERIRFAEFELKVRTRELWKNGRKLNVQGQPFQILSTLLERPGELITRDELTKRLWPDNTFVDFEHSLNRAVNRLREALEDSAERPRFIETLPGLGYRFISAIDEDEKDLGRKTVPWRVLLPVGLLVVVISVGAAWFLWTHRRQPITARDTIVLADFANSTGDAVFDDSLKQALSIALAQSPFLNILSDGKVAGILKFMTLPANTPLTRNVAQEICQRAGSKAYIIGSIASLGSEYVLGLKAVDCQSGDTLAQEQVTAPAKEKLLDTLGHAAARLRKELGESLASVEKYDKPLEEATTSSLEALQALTQGLRTARAQDSSESISFCKRAVELDPNFAMAYACLGSAYNNARDATLAIQNFTKAYQLRERASQRERFLIESSFFSMATGQLEKANQAYIDWARVYPVDVAPHTGLNRNYSTMGQYEKAAAEALESIKLRPESAVAYGNLVGDYVNLNKLDEAKKAFEQARAHQLDGGALRANRYSLAFVQGDATAMQEQTVWAAGKAGLESLLVSMQSDTEAYYGRISRARELSERAVELAAHVSDLEAAAEWRANEALREAEIGNVVGARSEAARALALSSGRDVEFVAALAFARAGELLRAQRLADKLDQEFPLDTMMQNYFLPTIRAAIELQRHSPGNAIEILKVVIPYQRGGSSLGNLYPTYVRGQAYLQAGQIQPAIAEFQGLVDQPFIVLNSVWGTLSRLQLARAKAKSGDETSARKAYQDFLEFWKDVDPEIPILKQAKVEYSELR
jgi:DNA-binding winged helix-turn-helix (wHTH) protein/Flp pilus assembly protein TadD